MGKFAKLFLGMSLTACLAISAIMPVYAEDAASPKYWEMPFGAKLGESVKVKANAIEGAKLENNSLFTWSNSEAGSKITIKDDASKASDWAIFEFNDVEGQKWQRLDVTDGLWLHYNIKVTTSSEALKVLVKMGASDGTYKLSQQSFSGLMMDQNCKLADETTGFVGLNNGEYKGKINLIPLLEAVEKNVFDPYKDTDVNFDFEANKSFVIEDLQLVVEGINEAAEGSTIEIGYLIFDDENASNTLNKGSEGTNPTPTQKPDNTNKPTNKPDNNQTGDVSMLFTGLLAAAATFGGLKLRRRK